MEQKWLLEQGRSPIKDRFKKVLEKTYGRADLFWYLK